MGSLAFWAIGFGIMFGASSTGWFGTSGFFLSDFTVGGDPWVLAFWMFQVVFCATAATIIGGTSAKIIGVQLLGIGACFMWVFPAAFLMFKLIDKTVGLRVSPEEEMEGLDLAEHGGNAYPDFEVSSYGGIGATTGQMSAAASPETIGQFKPVQQS